VAGSGSRTASVQCNTGEVALGGGGVSSVTTADINESRPLNAAGTPATPGQSPRGWRVTMDLSTAGTVTVYAVCAPG
jgi:hypothetical protein